MPRAAALRAAGLALGTITPRNDPALAAGTVISADQPTGSELAGRHGGEPRGRDRDAS